MIIFDNDIEVTNIVELDKAQKHKLATNVSNLMVSSLLDFGLSKDDLYSAICNANIYFADFKDNISGKYYFKTNSIYLSSTFDVLNCKNITSNIIHEIIHFLQSEFSHDNKILRMGLFKTNKFLNKNIGVGINEAAVQYLASNIVSEKPDVVKYFGLSFATPSPDYYPLETALIKQMSYFTGSYPLFYSTLFSNDIFEDTFSTISSNESYRYISKNINKIIKLQEKLCVQYNYITTKKLDEDQKINCLNKISNTKDRIRNITLDTQDVIYRFSFENELNKVNTIQDVINFQTSLNNFENYLITYPDNDSFSEFKNEISFKLSEKLSLIEAYGNYNFAMSAKKDITSLPKIYSTNILKTLFSKIKLLVDLRFGLSRASKENLYKSE